MEEKAKKTASVFFNRRKWGNSRRVQTTSQAGPPYLPGEITDIIISFFPDDRNFFLEPLPDYRSLCSCALVCRNWLPASRHALFTHIVIESDEQYALFVSSAVHSQPGRSWLPSTRRFTLRREDDPGNSNATRLFIHELGGQFPNLEELSLRHLYFDMMESSPSPRKFAALSAFASVRTLDLWDCTFPSFAAARYTLASLPSLTDLTVGNTTWPIVSNPEPLLPFLRSSHRPPFLRRVRSLYFLDGDATCDCRMLRWLSTTSLGASLADLTVFPTAFKMNVTGLWEYVGLSTTHLSIVDVRAMEDLLIDSFIGSLHHFTRLQSLALSVMLMGKAFEPWESMGTLISTGSLNPGIKILSIYFAWHPDSVDNGSLSNGLELVLRKAEVLDPLLEISFKQLATLSLNMDFAWPHDLQDEWDHLRTCLSQPAIEDALRKKLPKISHKVSLNVSVSHRWR